ncbi:hypothetical protein Rs2_11932 [Raphanus sativus]|nr:hypothetical protein Rs2_11932 [Raphanus sativus]
MTRSLIKSTLGSLTSLPTTKSHQEAAVEVQGEEHPSHQREVSTSAALGIHPNYMANTESYRAKVWSQSAPRQRLHELSSESGCKRSVLGQYYYYYTVAAERSFDQRSDKTMYSSSSYLSSDPNFF